MDGILILSFYSKIDLGYILVRHCFSKDEYAKWKTQNLEAGPFKLFFRAATKPKLNMREVT